MEVFIVLRLEQAQEGDRENGMSAALGTKAYADAHFLFDQRHHLGGRGVRIPRAK